MVSDVVTAVGVISRVGCCGIGVSRVVAAARSVIAIRGHIPRGGGRGHVSGQVCNAQSQVSTW